MMALVIAVGLFGASAGSAAAAPMPSYDTAKHCDQGLGGRPAGPAEREQCLTQERTVRDWTTPRWSALGAEGGPARIKPVAQAPT